MCHCRYAWTRRKHINTDDLGYFGEEGYKGLVNDVQEYTMYLKREFPNLPFILLGIVWVHWL